MKRPRLTEIEARERAARTSGTPRHALPAGIEHAWGWEYATDRDERVFVDATTGVATAADEDDHPRRTILVARGPMGVPPWSPPPRSWWSTVKGWFGARST